MGDSWGCAGQFTADQITTDVQLCTSRDAHGQLRPSGCSGYYEMDGSYTSGSLNWSTADCTLGLPACLLRCSPQLVSCPSYVANGALSEHRAPNDLESSVC